MDDAGCPAPAGSTAVCKEFVCYLYCEGDSECPMGMLCVESLCNWD